MNEGREETKKGQGGWKRGRETKRTRKNREEKNLQMNDALGKMELLGKATAQCL